MRIALTGTPGTGKSTLAAWLALCGIRVVDLKAWAAAEGCIAGRDEVDDVDIIDVSALSRRPFPRSSVPARPPAPDLPTPAMRGTESWPVGQPQPTLPSETASWIVCDGHLSHLLPLDAIWVLRCDPRSVRKRLEARSYPEPKVRENVEAEALDIILQESLETGLPVVQRDGTRRTPSQLALDFVAATGRIPRQSEPDVAAQADGKTARAPAHGKTAAGQARGKATRAQRPHRDLEEVDWSDQLPFT